MKTLYLECNMGAAGDMLTAALAELTDKPDEFENRFNALGIRGVSLKLEPMVKCGIKGTYSNVRIDTDGSHHHSSLNDIEHLISQLNITDRIKKDAISVYRILAEAEGYVHDCKPEHIHFHEVGTLDAVSDIVSVCMLINELKPGKIIASPVAVGSGQVRCAHGILPVPAPATAYILRDVPIYAGNVSGELCTPTGAALLKYFADEFAPMSVMKISKTGYGMGKRDYESANCVRAFIGETEKKDETVTELRFNVDDMTGEEIGFAVEELLSQGALDVYTSPIYMKKNRPAILITVLCDNDSSAAITELIFRHTTTIGIREFEVHRRTLMREETTIKTEYGDVRIKRSEGYGASKVKAEYDDLARIAKREDIPLKTVKALIQRQAEKEKPYI